MDEQIIDSGVNATTEEVTAEQTTESAVASPEASSSQSEAGIEQTNQQPTKEEIYDALKDERAKRMWMNDKGIIDYNKIYKSYRNLEKMHEPLKTKYGVIESTFKELGIPLDPLQIKGIAQEYNQLKDPNNPVKQKADYFSLWIDNPLYQEKVKSFYTSLEEEEKRRQFPGMSDDQIKKQVAIENELREIRQEREKQEQEKKYNSEVSTAKDGWLKIRKLADSRGFGFTDQIAENVIDHMTKNKIDSRYLYHTFLELYGEQLDKTFSESTEKKVLEKLNKNKQAGVIPAKNSSKGTISNNNPGDLRSNLRKAMDKMLGT